MKHQTIGARCYKSTVSKPSESTLQQIETGSSSKVPEIGNGGNHFPQPSGCHAELRFIMRIDEIKPAVDNTIARLSYHLLK